MSETKWKGLPLFFCGICMGIADLIPGISGGTIAFMMGFYNQLLDSINSCKLPLLFKGQLTQFFRQLKCPFLLTLGSGIAFSFIAFSTMLQVILNHETYRIYLYATFLGLILASCGLCLKQIKEWKQVYCVGLFIGATIAFFLTLPTTFFKIDKGLYAVKMELAQQANNFDGEFLKNLDERTINAMVAKGIVTTSDPLYDHAGKYLGTIGTAIPHYIGSNVNFWLIFCGSIAICALLLPGISGSYILTLLGAYPLIIGALADLIIAVSHLSFDKEAFFILLNVGIGILIGLLSFTRVISWLLQKFHDFTIAALTGFMIGALPSVWPFWSYQYSYLPLKINKGLQLEVISPFLPDVLTRLFLNSIVFCVVGFVLVIALEKSKQRFTKIVRSEVL